MGTFGFKKSIDDIEEPVLLPEDWYDFEILSEPKVRPNYDLYQEVGDDPSPEQMEELMKENPKMFQNIEIFMSTESPDPMYAGRKFTFRLPWPSDSDEDRYDNNGMKLYDARMRDISKFAEAFGGGADGDTVNIPKGGKGCAYVKILPAGTIDGVDEDRNTIDRFAGFKPYGER